jgi:hypothetical protein
MEKNRGDKTPDRAKRALVIGGGLALGTGAYKLLEKLLRSDVKDFADIDATGELLSSLRDEIDSPGGMRRVYATAIKNADNFLESAGGVQATYSERETYIRKTAEKGPVAVASLKSTVVAHRTTIEHTREILFTFVDKYNQVMEASEKAGHRFSDGRWVETNWSKARKDPAYAIAFSARYEKDAQPETLRQLQKFERALNGGRSKR